jgi:hypothetical protein
MNNAELNKKYIATLEEVRKKYNTWLEKTKQNNTAEILEASKQLDSAKKDYNKLLLELHKEWLNSNQLDN